jgi:hypothetical protein
MVTTFKNGLFLLSLERVTELLRLFWGQYGQCLLARIEQNLGELPFLRPGQI